MVNLFAMVTREGGRESQPQTVLVVVTTGGCLPDSSRIGSQVFPQPALLLVTICNNDICIVINISNIMSMKLDQS